MEVSHFGPSDTGISRQKTVELIARKDPDHKTALRNSDSSMEESGIEEGVGEREKRNFRADGKR